MRTGRASRAARERRSHSAARALDEVTLYQRVSVTGRFDAAASVPARQSELPGPAGLRGADSVRARDGDSLLVDRGWVPFTGSRAHLPDVGLADEAAGR